MKSILSMLYSRALWIPHLVYSVWYHFTLSRITFYPIFSVSAIPHFIFSPIGVPHFMDFKTFICSSALFSTFLSKEIFEGWTPRSLRKQSFHRVTPLKSAFNQVDENFRFPENFAKVYFDELFFPDLSEWNLNHIRIWLKSVSQMFEIEMPKVQRFPKTGHELSALTR